MPSKSRPLIVWYITYKISVLAVVYMLTAIRAVNPHKLFLDGKHKTLRESDDHWELFGYLNLYWNYLSYDLLDQLIDELTEKNTAFRKATTLELFCQAEPSTLDDDPPPGFKKMAVKLDWSDAATLEDVEVFRTMYADHYGFQKCAMVLNSIGKGCFTVNWFVQVSVIETLTNKISFDIFKELHVTILGKYVYPPVPGPQQESLQLMDPDDDDSSSTDSFTTTR